MKGLARLGLVDLAMSQGQARSYGVINDLDPPGRRTGTERRRPGKSVDRQTHTGVGERDRERAMTRRALERAARSGGEQRPGLARGGITSLARLLRQAGTTITNLKLGGPSSTAHLSGSAAQ